MKSSRLLFVFLSRYATVGAICATSELILFQVLHKSVGLHVMLSNVLAVSIVTVSGFFGQKYFTFRSWGRSFGQASLYILMLSISFALNNALVFIFVDILSLIPFFAKVLQLGLCFFFNFFFAHFVVFSPSAQVIRVK